MLCLCLFICPSAAGRIFLEVRANLHFWSVWIFVVGSVSRWFLLSFSTREEYPKTQKRLSWVLDTLFPDPVYDIHKQSSRWVHKSLVCLQSCGRRRPKVPGMNLKRHPTPCFDQRNYFPFEHWDLNPSRAQSGSGKKAGFVSESLSAETSSSLSTLLSGVRDSGNRRNHVTSPSSAITPPHTVCSTILCGQPTPREVNRWEDKQIWISVHCSFE